MSENKNEVGGEKNMRRKGVLYPSIDIEEAIALVRQLKDKFGLGPYPREEIAIAFGHSALSGPASGKIATCTQFGLLERAGNTYTISESAQKILLPTNEEESSQEITEAVRRPRMYAALIAKYDGQALPQMLENILCREYGISDKAVGRAVANLKKSFEVARILKNGVVMSSNLERKPAVAGSSKVCAEKCAAIEERREKREEPNNDEKQAESIMTIEIPETRIKITFPKEDAFRLTTGGLGEILNTLQKIALGKDKDDAQK